MRPINWRLGVTDQLVLGAERAGLGRWGLAVRGGAGARHCRDPTVLPISEACRIRGNERGWGSRWPPCHPKFNDKLPKQLLSCLSSPLSSLCCEEAGRARMAPPGHTAESAKAALEAMGGRILFEKASRGTGIGAQRSVGPWRPTAAAAASAAGFDRSPLGRAWAPCAGAHLQRRQRHGPPRHPQGARSRTGAVGAHARRAAPPLEAPHLHAQRRPDAPPPCTHPLAAPTAAAFALLRPLRPQPLLVGARPDFARTFRRARRRRTCRC